MDKGLENSRHARGWASSVSARRRTNAMPSTCAALARWALAARGRSAPPTEPTCARFAPPPPAWPRTAPPHRPISSAIDVERTRLRLATRYSRTCAIGGSLSRRGSNRSRSAFQSMAIQISPSSHLNSAQRRVEPRALLCTDRGRQSLVQITSRKRDIAATSTPPPPCGEGVGGGGAAP